MPETVTFKSLDEKHLLCEVQNMFWSPKMDLIAISTLNGEVILYRLSLHKVWTIKKLDDAPLVIIMAWRSDGKILAVAYNNSQIRLHSVESGELLHSFYSFDIHNKSINNEITFLCWSSEFVDNKTKFKTDSFLDELSFEYKLESSSDHFLPNLPEFSKQEFNSYSEFKNIKSEKMSLLIVGDGMGGLSLYAYGIIPISIIQLPKAQKILSVIFSNDFSSLSVVTCVDVSGFQDIYLCDTKILQKFSKEILMMASSFAYLWYLEKYANVSINQMRESWEDIILEMDIKLNKLAEDKAKRGMESVRKDFLMLLVYGKASGELKDFLQHDLTNQSLSKLGTSIVNSYSNILKLLLKHLQSVIQRISYELADIKGLSLITDRYEPLGLRPHESIDALDMSGSFMLKSVELQQVIEKSLSNFKAFFNWILPIKSMFSAENTNASLKQSNEQKIEFVAQFINENFSRPSFDLNKQGFKLEKVGQYLENKDLSCPCDNTNINSWKTLLDGNKKLADNPLIYKTYREKSLIQLHNMVTHSIDGVITNSLATISKSLFATNKINLLVNNLDRMLSVTQILSKNSNEILTAFSVEMMNMKSGFCILKQDCNSKESCLAALKIEKVGDLNNIRIMDLDFFSPNILVLLVQVDGNLEAGGEKLSFISQVSTLTNFFVPVGERFILNDLSDFKSVDDEIRFDPLTASSNMRPVEFAVSGPRKTACILFSSRRRIKLFLAEDDDDLNMQISQLDATNLGHSDLDVQLNQSEQSSVGPQDIDLTSSEIMDYSIDSDNKENTV